MKNIHILQTDKPSRFYKNEISELGFLSEKLTNTDSFCVSYNIYITSDEEIKEGDWIFDLDVKKVLKADNLKVTTFKKSQCWYYKKIILTTDQDLIKDGVQAIDDEFLEWFVKNPSCEEVEVYKDERLEFEQDFHFYEIIIPKEEPKQSIKDRIMSDTSEESKQKARDYANSLVEKQETVFENAKLILRKHILKNKEQVIKDLDEMRKLSNEQETLEESGEYQQELFNYLHDLGVTALQSEMQEIERIVLAMQDKNKYSEEEVLHLLEMLQKCKEYFLLKTDLKSEERADAIGQVLENFKNK